MSSNYIKIFKPEFATFEIFDVLNLHCITKRLPKECSVCDVVYVHYSIQGVCICVCVLSGEGGGLI